MKARIGMMACTQEAGLFINKSKTPINMFCIAWMPDYNGITVRWQFEVSQRELQNRSRRFKKINSMHVIQGLSDESCIRIDLSYDNIKFDLALNEYEPQYLETYINQKPKETI